MKCKLKVNVIINFQDGQLVNLSKVLYVLQAVKTLLRVSRIISKGAMMGSTQDKIIIKKNGVSIILDTSTFQNKSMILYLKAKMCAPEVQEVLANIP